MIRTIVSVNDKFGTRVLSLFMKRGEKMPILCFREKLKINDYEVTISFAFNCIYNNSYHLNLKDCIPNYFDCGDFRIKIEEAISNLSYELLREYEQKNGEVRFLGILNYFYDNIPELYSIKFESETGDSIYYVSELKNRQK